MNSNDIENTEYSEIDRETLLSLARKSIQHGIDTGRALVINPASYSDALQQQRASFVTLTQQKLLRGCIGHLQAYQPLVIDVVENAFSAAFNDPRFPALGADELEKTQIEISVLSIPQALEVENEQQLIQKLNPGKDGLILEDGLYRATFLPSVWEQLPRAEEFVEALKSKAGMPSGYWSNSMQIFIYHTISFSEK